MRWLWSYPNWGVAYRHRFFYAELDHVLDLDELLLEAYILVHRVGFTYKDVKELTRTERTAFLKLFQEELKREDDEIKRVHANR